MSTYQTSKLKWFWAWQDEKEEAWLSKMAEEGLHLTSVSPFGLYHFRKGDPEKYVYRLDFQTLKLKDRESYLQLFEDAGWEHIGDMGGWVYFRQKFDGSEIPDIYSNLESKIGKYQRVMAILVVFLPILVVLFPDSRRLDYFGPVLFTILEALRVLLLLVFIYAMIMLFRRINQLKNRINQ